MHQKCAVEVNPIGPTRQPARESAEAEHARKTYSKRRKPSGVDDATKRNFHHLRVISERVFPFFLAGRQISSALTGKSRVRKTLVAAKDVLEANLHCRGSATLDPHPYFEVAIPPMGLWRYGTRTPMGDFDLCHSRARASRWCVLNGAGARIHQAHTQLTFCPLSFLDSDEERIDAEEL
ncbi:hypothetical protein [Bradyrhizobium liaoningense]|uniref:hypothetical protein n=1 Tax=Bradyrhizobium liaoningense TaxID=43992 RepID=UPI002011838A|nr:hypothetical protein [Bradyrhizobium liaoningense]